MTTKELTVLDRTYEILRAHGLTTIFGNPGSNELPFLASLPDDFSYVLGLQEAVVTGMAEGYSRATGQPALVSLHAASGTGNAMGALTNAVYAHVPLVLLAGQQVRRTVGQEVMLANVDAGMLTKPLVKWAGEPLAAEDVPRAMSQAILEAITQRGPTYLSVPWDDWAHKALESDALLPSRRVKVCGALSRDDKDELLQRIANWKRPVLVLGPDADGAQKSSVQLAERLGAAVWIAPSAPRCPYPTTHAHYRGLLPPGVERVRSRLEDYDGILVIGAPLMRYHRWEPAAYTNGQDVVHITQDNSEATRAPYGDSYVANVHQAIAALAADVPDRGERLERRSTPPAATSEKGMTGEQVLAVLDKHVGDSITYVNEATTLDVTFLERMSVSRENQYHFPASGGLGFGLPCAVGLALGRPDWTVVAVIGDGSANYALPALYAARTHNTRTIFVIVNNASYGALRRFAVALQAESSPGLDIPGIDFVSLAKGYGVPASTVSTPEELDKAYTDALEAQGPVLIDARVVQ
ncbi:benzoylformate decarboxylase [Trichosporon asahii var. asahii CBS 2479]|uniref:Benzoylformate decarboxylase n=1 Tax=Trichosporon asahii var. asahii (strain ATCC 90039 / CBS 2479 / JCM 2466 / KCTC 7840 / NBRC 103889/ NCYC 2677 / UAMH 7654) TaxID=1186058 RepID=J6ESE6_TRIAS|nr:benzoylformate decarboxylase [Trichosporon asahii var. asahii CBS 2479]EJT47454.1 benzoylformate decarboxylase [Trichosporon asahii var. asahii CBS 2479]